MSRTKLQVKSASMPACSVELSLSVRTDLGINHLAILVADAGPFEMRTYITADELAELSSQCLLAAEQLRNAETQSQVIKQEAA